MTIDRHTAGHLYLLHFGTPLGNPDSPRGMASHYLGWACDAERRIAAHLAGRSQVRIVQAALAAGIALTPVILGPGPKDLEWQIKRQKVALAHWCPICAARPRPLPARQLALPLDVPDDWDFDQVPVPPTPAWDWYQTWWRRTTIAYTGTTESFVPEGAWL